jgi:PKD repeat protein
MSPVPAPANADIFFNATASKANGPGRTIVEYRWNFGDGATSVGVTTTHKYAGNGSYTITLTVADDAQATAQATQTLVVGSAASAAGAQLTILPSAPKPGQRVVLDASDSKPGTGATIVEYKFDYGDGTIETSNNPVQSHTYSAGNFVAAVTITDSLGKTSTKAVSFEVKP